MTSKTTLSTTPRQANKIINSEKVPPRKVLKDLLVNFCIGFTLLILFSCIFGLIFADEAAKPGIIMCLSIGVAMLICAVLQLIFFTPILIKHMGYVWRLSFFGICLYVILALYGAAFSWFPADNLGAWIAFTVTYLIVLAFMSVIFTFINKRNIKTLNKKLTEFKAEHSEQENNES